MDHLREYRRYLARRWRYKHHLQVRREVSFLVAAVVIAVASVGLVIAAYLKIAMWLWPW